MSIDNIVFVFIIITSYDAAQGDQHLDHIYIYIYMYT